jgi:hypothetical protein
MHQVCRLATLYPLGRFETSGAGRAKWPILEGGKGVDEDRTLVEVAVGDGSTLQVAAFDYGGAQDVATLGPVSLGLSVSRAP